MQDPLVQWQKHMWLQIVGLIKRQNVWLKELLQSKIDTEAFNAQWLQHLQKFHQRMVPSHDHHGLKIAKAGLEAANIAKILLKKENEPQKGIIRSLT